MQAGILYLEGLLSKKDRKTILREKKIEKEKEQKSTNARKKS